jgi:uncharacterized membrane protein YphA (DoxX/SURF4 family)
MGRLEQLLEWLHENKGARRFTVLNRILLAFAFLPSGFVKLAGERFTRLGIDSPVGFFFEAMYRTGGYWQFLGFMQLLAALLLLIPRTAPLGAVLYFPIILNIFLITVSLGFRGTPVITGLMLLASSWLVCWEYKRWKPLLPQYV